MLDVWVHPLGATLAGLWVRGYPRSLVLGFASGKTYGEIPIYAGAVVGPVANRISKGIVRLGTTICQMDCNEPPNSLHSGKYGLHGRVWRILKQSETHVVLATDLADGAAGLPGHRRIEVRYSLRDDAGLDVHLTAISDAETVMNLAHHPYWTLDGRADVGAHHLEVAAQSYIPTWADLLPKGPPEPVAFSPYDFRSPRLVPVDQALDANFCLAMAPRPTAEFAARLTGANGLCLTIETTEPGLQVYNGSALPQARATMHPGQRLAPYAGITLEPQGWPDAPNMDGYPPITLQAGQVYSQQTRYSFSLER